MAMVLPLRTAWIADTLLQASIRDVQRHCWKRGSGDGQRLWDHTARLSDLSKPFRIGATPLKGEVRRSPEPVCKAIGGSRYRRAAICTMCIFSLGLKRLSIFVYRLTVNTNDRCIFLTSIGYRDLGHWDRIY